MRVVDHDAHQADGETVKDLQILDRQRELGIYHLEGIARRELTDEFGAPTVGETVDAAVDDCRDERIPPY